MCGSIALAVRQIHTDLTVPLGMVYLVVFAAVVLVIRLSADGAHRTSRKQPVHSSNTDTLTGLLNQRALLEAADKLFDLVHLRQERVVLLFADINRFNSVNDGKGHAAGDQVLQQLGGILRDSIRDGDVAARYGGGEFAILLNNACLDEGEQIARRIHTRVQALAQEQGVQCGVTIALGEAPTPSSTIDVLLDRVDEALYRSQSQRGGGIRSVVAQVPAS